jgi:hypothetical protein
MGDPFGATEGGLRLSKALLALVAAAFAESSTTASAAFYKSPSVVCALLESGVFLALGFPLGALGAITRPNPAATPALFPLASSTSSPTCICIIVINRWARPTRGSSNHLGHPLEGYSDCILRIQGGGRTSVFGRHVTSLSGEDLRGEQARIPNQQLLLSFYIRRFDLI